MSGSKLIWKVVPKIFKMLFLINMVTRHHSLPIGLDKCKLSYTRWWQTNIRELRMLQHCCGMEVDKSTLNTHLEGSNKHTMCISNHGAIIAQWILKFPPHIPQTLPKRISRSKLFLNSTNVSLSFVISYGIKVMVSNQDRGLKLCSLLLCSPLRCVSQGKAQSY